MLSWTLGRHTVIYMFVALQLLHVKFNHQYDTDMLVMSTMHSNHYYVYVVTTWHLMLNYIHYVLYCTGNRKPRRSESEH